NRRVLGKGTYIADFGIRRLVKLKGAVNGGLIWEPTSYCAFQTFSSSCSLRLKSGAPPCWTIAHSAPTGGPCQASTPAAPGAVPGATCPWYSDCPSIITSGSTSGGISTTGCSTGCSTGSPTSPVAGVSSVTVVALSSLAPSAPETRLSPSTWPTGCSSAAPSAPPLS